MQSTKINTSSEYDDNWLINTVNDLEDNIIICRHYPKFPINELEKNKNVFAYLHGHTHYYDTLIDTRFIEQNNIYDMDISSIESCHAGDSNHSYLFKFENNSKKIMISDYNHSNDKWLTNFTMFMPYNFVGDSVNIIFCSDIHIDNIECGLFENYDNFCNFLEDTNNFPVWKYCFVLGDIADIESFFYLLDKEGFKYVA